MAPAGRDDTHLWILGFGSSKKGVGCLGSGFVWEFLEALR